MVICAPAWRIRSSAHGTSSLLQLDTPSATTCTSYPRSSRSKADCSTHTCDWANFQPRGEKLSLEGNWYREKQTSMPMRTKDLKSRLPISEMNSGVTIEKSDFSKVARRSAPSDARSMRSSVLPRATVEYTMEERGLAIAN